jgi:uncharacterized cupin superfamily protein
MKLWRNHDPLVAVHFAQQYIPAKFAPPRDIYAGNFLRLEWQQMNTRQPFYHRNADVDEISYQVSGERTLMTELGSVELRPGDFSRIPVAIAHDNYGREEIHLLFYIHGPAKECGKIVGSSEPKRVPFDGWKAATVTEMMTECLGARGCDISVSLTDEEMLLDPTANESASGGDRILVQQATSAVHPESEWLFQTARVWIGTTRLKDDIGGIYHRHRKADAIHCQISGTRILITQRGTVELQPGDFISIPKGCAYTSVCSGESFHILILTSEDTPIKADVAKEATATSPNVVAAARERVLQNLRDANGEPSHTKPISTES